MKPERERNDTSKVNSAHVGDSQDLLPPKKSIADMLERHWQLLVMLLLVLVIAGTYIWKNVAVSSAKTELTQLATQVIGEQNRSHLRLVSIPLVWAIRSEMIRGNYDQVNQYLTQFVKEPGMKEIIVAGPDGKGVVATNKKREGAYVTDSFQQDLLQKDTATVSALENGEILVTAPIMGLNSRLGTLILVCSAPSYSLEKPLQ